MDVSLSKKSREISPSKSWGEVREGLGLLILAGGVSKRIVGKKSLLEIAGKPMIQLVAARVSVLSKEMVISYKSGKKELEKLFPNAEIVLDKWVEKGALTGIRSSLPRIKSEYVALLACDCPFVKPEVIEILYKGARGHDGAILKWPDGRIEPLQAVYRTRSLRDAVEDTWKSGKMRVGVVLERLDIVYLTPEKLKKVDPELMSFININSLEDISRLRRRFRSIG